MERISIVRTGQKQGGVWIRQRVCATVRSRVRSMAHLLVLSMVLIATFRARLLIRVGGGELLFVTKG